MGDPVSALLIGGTALKVGSGIAGARSEGQAYAYRAAEADVAARQGRIRAAETSATLREQLNSVISNIRAIRASAGASPDSPTAQAVIDENARIAERQRRTQVNNELMQVASDERSARLLRRSGRDAFLYGSIGSIGSGAIQIAGNL